MTATPRTSTAPPDADEPLPHRRIVFGIVSIALLMASIDQTIVATALTAIQHDLDAPLNWSGWTITIYALGQILVMPVAGRLGDQFGRKRIFLGAAVLFTLASLACSLVDNIYLLVVFRALQAIGGGAFMPTATGIVAEQFGRDRDRAVGMFTSIFPIGGVLGPIIGGVIVTYWSWREIFLVNVPAGLLLILLAARFIPRSTPAKAARIDLVGAALLALTILTGMYGITSLGSRDAGPLDPVFLTAEVLALVFGFLFVRHANRAASPFIPVRLLRGRGFGVMNAINLLYGAAVLGFGALFPLYAEARYGIQPLQAGTLLTARAVGMICVAGLAVFALRRTGYRAPMIGGFLLVAAGMTVMAIAPHGLTPYAWLAIAAGITGIGMGLSIPASNNASLQLAPDQISAIAGLRGMFRQSGGIIAVSVTTTLLSHSANPGIAQAHSFVVFAAVLLLIVPFTLLVPDHRGSW
ncbi:EmrB/QacA subfamily drug resistance transporter [Kribbella amoyensis]|uniref:EmrB/QacA subfamily drug resistance transporter n=1 Tax=Kribbella amoyensis TaxID=996641 RepID=A0A561BUL6_9ACTN|nr:MFS transporter [Kribbella amoyensis]TWD82610.1 EmrB/QacA subfamily drug resistance transporter [Kribbella amoyensis]